MCVYLFSTVNVSSHSRYLVSRLRLQLQTPGHYSPLEAFYEDKRALLPPSGDVVVTACPAIAWGAALNHSMHPEMKVGGGFPILIPSSYCLWPECVHAFYNSLTRSASLCVNVRTRSPTPQAACPSSSASLASRSWCCGNWLSSADASSSSPLPPWEWSATGVRNTLLCLNRR